MSVEKKLGDELAPAALSWEKRLAAVEKFMLLGNLRLVSEQTGIAYAVLQMFKKEPWWAEAVEQIRAQRAVHKNNKIEKIIELGLDVVEDRLENGDFILNNKTGQIIRKPVSAKEAGNITTGLIQRQTAIEELAKKHNTEQHTVQETLVLVAKEFAKLSNKIKKEQAQDLDYKELSDAIHEERKEGLQT